MSSAKILPNGDKATYGSMEKGGSLASRVSTSSSSVESQNAAAYSSLGVGGDSRQQQQEEISAVSFHDVHYSVMSLCTRRAKKILHGVK